MSPPNAPTSAPLEKTTTIRPAVNGSFIGSIRLIPRQRFCFRGLVSVRISVAEDLVRFPCLSGGEDAAQGFYRGALGQGRRLRTDLGGARESRQISRRTDGRRPGAG